MEDAPTVSVVGSSNTAHVPREIVELANKLMLKHGSVRISKESGGWHLYFASPLGLERHGRIELSKKHCAVNAEMGLSIGRYRRSLGTIDADACGLCMKTGKKYRLSELLRMPPLASRGIPVGDSYAAKISVNDTSRSLVRDANGNLVPDVPGDTVSLAQLPADHPAVIYLVGRGYSIPSLVSQFDARFCTREQPEDRSKGRFYMRYAGGFRDTPQNRIIFNVDIGGIRKGWQARYIEHVADDVCYVLHPYQNNWVPVARRLSPGVIPALSSCIGKGWEPLPGFDKEHFDLAKYKTAFGSSRNQIVMGIDAALRWNRAMGTKVPVCAVSEGPLDAGKIGAPGLALMGKFMSDNQAKLIATYFRRVVVVADNDDAGQKAKADMLMKLSPYVSDVPVAVVPAPCKDIGELPDQAAALQLLGPYLFK